MDLEKFQEQIFFSTVRITTISASTGGSSIGTGFIFRVPVDKKMALLLVSNRHVYGDTKQVISLNFHKRKDDTSGPDLGNIISLNVNDYTNAYIGHPNPNIDLAAINITQIAQPESKIFYKSISSEMFATFSEKDLLPGGEVWFVGYPQNRYDQAHNLPLLRKGHIASIPKIDFNSKKEFIIDAQVFRGSSGSPVFAALSGKYRLLGIVTETMLTYGQVQSVPTGTTLGVEQLLGLGIVIKVSLIKELVDHVITLIKLEEKHS